MISIIIPTYNRLNDLKKCLESIISQQQEGIEIIVIDDYSTDGTRSYLNDFFLNNNNMVVIFNKYNAGVNYTRNRGIEKATKPFILFLDSDDALLPNALSKIILNIKRHPHVKHFLSYLSYRSEEFSNLKSPRPIFYQNWVNGTISGDFTHILSTSIMLKYPFFEEFRMFEQLNWYRIFRETSPQLLLPFASAEINLDSTDSLRLATKAKTWDAVHATFDSQTQFYNMYAKDLAKYNPKYLKYKLIKNILLGIACKKVTTSKQLIKYAKGLHIKIAAYFIIFFPPQIIRYAFIKTGRVK